MSMETLRYISNNLLHIPFLSHHSNHKNIHVCLGFSVNHPSTHRFFPWKKNDMGYSTILLDFPTMFQPYYSTIFHGINININQLNEGYPHDLRPPTFADPDAKSQGALAPSRDWATSRPRDDGLAWRRDAPCFPSMEKMVKNGDVPWFFFLGLPKNRYSNYMSTHYWLYWLS